MSCVPKVPCRGKIKSAPPAASGVGVRRHPQTGAAEQLPVNVHGISELGGRSAKNERFRVYVRKPVENKRLRKKILDSG
jgi:hypothetical protein